MHISFFKYASSFAVALLACSPVFAAEVNARDAQVVGRAMTFAVRGSPSSMSLAVIFDRSNYVSVAQANSVVQRFAQYRGDGGTVVRAVAVDQNNVGSLRGYDGVFASVGVDQAILGRLLSRSGTPCFTIDMGQVSNGACQVGVKSYPSVGIFFNARNASSAGVQFATAFIMMVKPL